jgi:serine protease
MLSMGAKRWASRILVATILAVGTTVIAAVATPIEFNPVRTRPVSIGPEASRLLVGFKANANNTVVQTVHSQRRALGVKIVQANTSASDVAGLAARSHVSMQRSRQMTPSMHVMFLEHTLYGSSVSATLATLRADPAVAFAEIDERRYPHGLPPDDPLFATPATGTGGQWYMMAPSTTGDASATDAISAWAITTGSSGIVIADIDTGVNFDHPDLLRAGFGGRLLPGYDFVGGDLSKAGAELGTYLIANDGDGWDPDPSDPGDWINKTDQMNALFPATGTDACPIQDSSWHGTRVMGILGALTDNATGVAGMTWQPYLLPVRALGKCGGYDSDIITAMEWSVGMAITGVPTNPYPADIVNLSLGGSGSCPSDYATAVNTVTAMGVLIVASAGNETGPVDAPANCTGVLGVAGLRNVGTKVGYSSLGAQVSVAAPAGNCVNASGPCLKSIDTTSNSGLTVPADNIYTSALNPNLGTSFSAPIVSSIAALMRSVNANLTPAQLIARIKASAVAFPQPAGLPVCSASTSATDTNSGECACPNDGSQCGSGMVNALNAVNSALRPIAAVKLPSSSGNGKSVVLDGSGSSAACGIGLASYAWTATGATLQPGTAASATATIVPTGTAGRVVLTVTDALGKTDSATINVSSSGSLSYTGSTTAGTTASACPVALTVTPLAPTVTEAFSPASVDLNVTSTLLITLTNANAFDLTRTNLTETLPAGLVMASASSSSAAAPATTCTGGSSSLTTTASTVNLVGAIIPAKGSCTVSVPVQSAAYGSYVNTIAAGALVTGPAGSNAEPVSATLLVAAPAATPPAATTPTTASPAAKPSSGGGGELDWWDTLFVVGVLLAGRRHGKRAPRS